MGVQTLQVYPTDAMIRELCRRLIACREDEEATAIADELRAALCLHLQAARSRLGIPPSKVLPPTRPQ